MKHGRRRSAWLLAVGLLVIGLPIAAKWLRGGSVARCVFDGLRIDPLFRVRIVTDNGESKGFCCMRCAAKWLGQDPNQPAAVFVTDEASGTEVDHRQAFFVQSPVTTNAITGNRVHTFRLRTDAEAHVRAFGGTLLDESNRPLRMSP